MSVSRRDLAMLLPALAAIPSAAESPKLPSKVYHSDRIPYTGDAHKKGREFFHAAEHSGFNLEAHETILGAGTQTHEPHRHVHDEMVILMEGTLETYLEGRTEIAETGSVVYFASNQMHSVRNAGSTPARYYVLELRGA